MKRVAILLSAVTIVVASASAFADPSSADETTSFASSFPQITTYADLHRNDITRQASTPFPSSADETTSLFSTFPHMTTYADLHEEDGTRHARSQSATDAM